MIAPLDPGVEGAALADLQRAAYAVEAELIGAESLPPMQEDARAVRGLGLSWLGARDAHGLTGAVGYQRVDDLVDIHRLVVHPRAFRQGIATALLDALEAREAAEGTVRRYTVGTGAANLPAVALYERRGFRVAEVREVAPGLQWLRLDRRVRG